MAITEAMKMRAENINNFKIQAEQTMKLYKEGLKELYKQFLKENGLDDYVCHKANLEHKGERVKAFLYIKEWDNGNTNAVEIRYKLANEEDVGDSDYHACSRFTTDPVKVMQEILDNYVPYYNTRSK